MRRLASLVILGCLLLAGQLPAQAAAPGSDWPSLNYDAAQSNYNAAEKVLAVRNVLKLKVRWVAPAPYVSYPIVAGGRVYVPFLSQGRVHVRALDAGTGNQVASFPEDARGGLLFANGSTLYLAGKSLQAFDPSTHQKLGQIDAIPKLRGGVFLAPVSDQKIILAGYTSTVSNGPRGSLLYAIDPTTNQVLWKTSSMDAQGTIAMGRILTETASGSEFYDETSGKPLVSQPYASSDWFAGSVLSYTIAALKRGKATLYAVDGTGHQVWKHVVGPYMATRGWPYAISPTAVYVQTRRQQPGVLALDPELGEVLWSRAIPFIQRMVLANGVLLVLTDALGQPVRLVAVRAQTGAIIGAIVLSAGYYAYSAPNDLIAADGMVFIHAVGPKGPVLIALGLPGA